MNQAEKSNSLNRLPPAHIYSSQSKIDYGEVRISGKNFGCSCSKPYATD